jgi:hypothetical protein
MNELEKLYKDIAYGANQIPGAGGAPGVVQPIIAAFSILEQRIEQLSIKVMIERENLTLALDRIKELENKPCCKENVESKVSAEDTKTEVVELKSGSTKQRSATSTLKKKPSKTHGTDV